MKKLLPCLLCVLFLAIASSIGTTLCLENEKVVFSHNGRVFNYSLTSNIKHASTFDANYEINKFNRFSSKAERQKLLTNLLEIGIEKPIALNYLFPNLSKQISVMEKNVELKPKNAVLKINHSSEKVFDITHEIVGKKLDTSKLFDQLCHNYLYNLPLKFELPLITLNPEVTEKDFLPHLNLRADFSTNISSSSADRKHNVKNALMRLNKVEIEPNEVFSFNKMVGRRTAENGYRQAKIIVNNEFVDGIGGGVCQVSSTLYNSALLAGLEILEANKHSKQVSYVTQGFDAMVNFGSSDLKFRNNTKEKITLITNYSSSCARIRIFGETLGKVKYTLTNEVFNIQKPTEETLIDENGKYLDKVKFEDEYFYLKKANTGMEIKTFRNKHENGVLVSTELIRHDKFKVQNAIKVYGNKKREDKNLPFFILILKFKFLFFFAHWINIIHKSL